MRGRSRSNLATGFLWIEYGFVCIADGMLRMLDSILYSIHITLNGGRVDDKWTTLPKKAIKNE